MAPSIRKKKGQHTSQKIEVLLTFNRWFPSEFSSNARGSTLRRLNLFAEFVALEERTLSHLKMNGQEG